MITQTSYQVTRVAMGMAFQEYTPDPALFVADRIFPDCPTPVQAGYFPIIDADNWNSLNDVDLNAAGDYPMIDMEAKDGNFSCVERGLMSLLTQKQAAFYAKDFDAAMAKTKILLHRMSVAREARAQALIQDTSTFTGTPLYTDNSGTPWSTVGTDIIGQVEAARLLFLQNTGMLPNALVIPYAVIPWLRANTGLRSQITYAATITRADFLNALAGILGVDQILMPAAVKNTANKGLTLSNSQIWSRMYVSLLRIGTGDLVEPCIGKTFRWVPESPSDLTMEMWWDEDKRGTKFRARNAIQEKIMSPLFGHLMKISSS